MTIPTEPIGSIPRALPLIAAAAAAGDYTDPRLEPLYTIARFDVDYSSCCRVFFSSTSAISTWPWLGKKIAGASLR